jgi:xanthine dehydrogenase accessory factor
VEQIAEAVRKDCESTVVARIVDIEGFSTRPGDDLVAIDSAGKIHGSLLAGLGDDALTDAARRMIAGGSNPAALGVPLVLDVGDKQAVSAGLACGGRAHVLLQPARAIPTELWDLVSGRAPAALVTPLDGGTGSSVVDRSGRCWGEAAGADLVDDALALLRAGRTDHRRVETPSGEYLVEAWVPQPRVVVVGGGELVEAIRDQAALLGWETRSASDAGDTLGALLDWAGHTAALAVLSHDPHVDSPALEEGLRRGLAYVGALGSRATQARRTERLLAAGVSDELIQTLHRPIGLDLGGRRAPEVALAIVAEILAAHHGRDARPLAARDGPIH